MSVLALLVVLQGQVLAFDLAEGLAAAGYITLAVTLTRYADRVDRILASTIYPAICAVQGRPATLAELCTKSNRLGLVWVVPFCAGLVLFAPDLVEFVLGDDWEPAVGLLQGMAVAAGLQQLGYNWFSFYRAADNSRPQAVESVVMVGSFLVLAVPASVRVGLRRVRRRAGSPASCSMLGVRRHYVRRSCPGVAARAARRARARAGPGRRGVRRRGQARVVGDDRDAGCRRPRSSCSSSRATTGSDMDASSAACSGRRAATCAARRRRRPCRRRSYSTNSVASRHTW